MSKKLIVAVIAAVAAVGGTAVGQSIQRFSDVPADHPQAAAIAWATGVGLTVGYGDGTFRPNEPLPRWAALTFMDRFYDRVLRGSESTNFTRGDMMVLLKNINDGGTPPPTATTVPAAPPMSTAVWRCISTYGVPWTGSAADRARCESQEGGEFSALTVSAHCESVRSDSRSRQYGPNDGYTEGDIWECESSRIVGGSFEYVCEARDHRSGYIVGTHHSAHPVNCVNHFAAPTTTPTTTTTPPTTTTTTATTVPAARSACRDKPHLSVDDALFVTALDTAARTITAGPWTVSYDDNDRFNEIEQSDVGPIPVTLAAFEDAVQRYFGSVAIYWSLSGCEARTVNSFTLT